MIQELKPAEEIVCFVAVRIQQGSRDGQCRDDQLPTAGVIALEEADDVRVSAGDGGDDACIEDKWLGGNLTHR